MSSASQKQLLALSHKLPAEKVREVVDFAEFLLSRTATGRANGTAKRSRALRRYVGGVKHGALAAGIDDELYGRPVR